MSEAEERERDEASKGEQAAPEGSLDKSDLPSTATAAAGARGDEPEDGDLDEVDLRELMRSVMDRPPGGAPPNILGGVQKKLRTRSRGKFYGDGWSTARTPRSTYLVTSLFMLALIAFVFLVLIPWGGGALPLP